MNDFSLKELGSNIDTTMVVVKPGDEVIARVKAVSTRQSSTRKLISRRTCSWRGNSSMGTQSKISVK